MNVNTYCGRNLEITAYDGKSESFSLSSMLGINIHTYEIHVQRLLRLRISRVYFRHPNENFLHGGNFVTRLAALAGNIQNL